MNIQEIEHAEFEAGRASEFQNCLAEAQGAAYSVNYKNAAAIEAALRARLFVVVAEFPYYCRATDAVAGTVRALHSTHETREEADAAVAALYSGFVDEERYEVLPKLPAPPAPVCDVTDDIPF